MTIGPKTKLSIGISTAAAAVVAIVTTTHLGSTAWAESEYAIQKNAETTAQNAETAAKIVELIEDNAEKVEAELVELKARDAEFRLLLERLIVLEEMRAENQ